MGAALLMIAGEFDLSIGSMIGFAGMMLAIPCLYWGWPVWLAVLFAFLAGGVILNVIKEELPEEQESLFWAFALGAALYTALLLAL